MARGLRERRRRADGGSGWSAADLAVLKEVLLAVRPSTPAYWQRVAASVGRSPTDCRLQALGGGVGAAGEVEEETALQPAAKRPRRGSTKADAAGAATELGPLPKKDGPRRAQRIREFIQARSFCPLQGHDFLALGPEGKPAADALGGGLAPAPPCDSSAGWLLGALGLDVGGRTWQPTGLDGFICKVQEIQSRCAARRARAAGPGCRAAGLCGSRSRWSVRAEARHAEALLRKIDHAEHYVEGFGPEIEDEADIAPVAAIPVACA